MIKNKNLFYTYVKDLASKHTAKEVANILNKNKYRTKNGLVWSDQNVNNFLYLNKYKKLNRTVSPKTAESFSTSDLIKQMTKLRMPETQFIKIVKTLVTEQN